MDHGLEIQQPKTLRRIEQFYDTIYIVLNINKTHRYNHWTLLRNKGSLQETLESALGQRDKCIKVLAPFGFPRCRQLF